MLSSTLVHVSLGRLMLICLVLINIPVNILSPNLYLHGKIKLNFMKACKN